VLPEYPTALCREKVRKNRFVFSLSTLLERGKLLVRKAHQPGQMALESRLVQDIGMVQ